jgi:hypothetical protein
MLFPVLSPGKDGAAQVFEHLADDKGASLRVLSSPEYELLEDDLRRDR